MCVCGGWGFCSVPLGVSPTSPPCEQGSSGGRRDGGGDAPGCPGTHAALPGLGLWGASLPCCQPPSAAFGAELELLPPRLGEGRLGGVPRAGLGAKAPPCLGSGLGSGFLRSTAKIEFLAAPGGGCSCPGKQSEQGLPPSRHPWGQPHWKCGW